MDESYQMKIHLPGAMKTVKWNVRDQLNFAQQSGRIRYDTDDVDDDETSDTYPKKSRKHAEVKPKLNRKKKRIPKKPHHLRRNPSGSLKGKAIPAQETHYLN